MRKKRLIIPVVLFILALALRLYRLSDIPPGLYIDEASIGYNAYTILENGCDEYGEKYPFLFRSFNDYKLPVYIYATSFSIFLFGKNEFAVRFPSAFSSALTIPIFFLFLNNLFKKKTIPLVSSFVLTVCPWHLQFGRGGFEVTLGLFFFTAGCLFASLFYKKNNLFFFFTGLLFYILSAYTYHIFRFLGSVACGFVFIVFFSKLGIKKSFMAVFFLILLLFPLVLASSSKTGITRFLQTSAFDKDKIIQYPVIFWKNYLSYFSFPFIFTKGDGIGRHQIIGFGPMLRLQMPLLLLGLYAFWKNKHKKWEFIIFLLLSPVVASLAKPSPHSLRSLPMVLSISVFIAFGMVFLIKKSKIFSAVLISVFFTLDFLFYLHYYFLHYPKTSLMDWGGGYKQLVEKTGKYADKYSIIAVSDKLQYAYIYFLFYNNKLKIITTNESWNKKGSYDNQPILYISTYIDKNTTKPSSKLIETVYLPNLNQDGFAQLWEI